MTDRRGLVERLRYHARLLPGRGDISHALIEAADALAQQDGGREVAAWHWHNDPDTIISTKTKKERIAIGDSFAAAYNKPLYASPPPAAVVTDAMVDAACAAHDPVGWKVACGETNSDMRHWMRAALTAALSARGE